MSEEEATRGDPEHASDARSSDAQGRGIGQAVLAAGAVVALLAAAALVPAVGAPLSGGPGDDQGDEGPGVAGPGGASPGALSPGPQTGVGGLGGGSGDALRNLSNEVHFVVRAERAAYWRTGAYGTYTGQGWRRSGAARAYDPPVVDATGERLRQRVTFNVSARAVPTAWRPVRAGADGRRLRVTDGDAIRVSGGVSLGTTLQAVSRLQDASAAELRDAGGEYPASVERYTRLPDETPDRLGAFTADLTSEADSAYETARLVELWLERSKRYSLNASHDPGAPVASHFVFEMERGYCEYFATAMVAMLRSQDIPARYVVGYAPGRQVGADRYEVRAMDAHAWVEVYFPHHGWVRFDPTPAADRRAVERGAGRAGEEGEDHRPPVEGSPGDDLPDGGLDPGDLPEDGLAPDTVPPPPYDVALNASPVPGRPVTVTVTKRDRPVEGVVVTVNGE